MLLLCSGDLAHVSHLSASAPDHCHLELLLYKAYVVHVLFILLFRIISSRSSYYSRILTLTRSRIHRLSSILYSASTRRIIVVLSIAPDRISTVQVVLSIHHTIHLPYCAGRPESKLTKMSTELLAKLFASTT